MENCQRSISLDNCGKDLLSSDSLSFPSVSQVLEYVRALPKVICIIPKWMG